MMEARIRLGIAAALVALPLAGGCPSWGCRRGTGCRSLGAVSVGRQGETHNERGESPPEGVIRKP